MPKKQAIIIFPHLNDCGGDLSQKWYVEYKWRVPGEPDMRKERVYKGLCDGPAADRKQLAAKIIKEKTKWLKSGAHLQGNERKVYADELMYRNEAKMFNKVSERVVTTRTNLSEYLRWKKQRLNHKSFMDYQSKLRIFNNWLEINKLDVLSIKNITRQHIVEFTIYLSEEKELSRLTIKKYVQIVHSFFDYELEQNHIQFNPTKKIEVIGKVVDNAAIPFSNNERTRLKKAIEQKDPQLWLACQIQYYCAIRPGTELRLMKISWIDFDRKKFRIPSPEAKSSRVDLVDIPDFLMKELLILKSYNTSLYVFGQYGMPNINPVGKNTLRNRFNKFRNDLGISPDRKFYSWKHTGAIQLLDNGAQPHEIKEHLRHRSFATTEIYLKNKAGNTGKKAVNFSTEI